MSVEGRPLQARRSDSTVCYDDTDQPGMLGFNRFALSGKRDAKPRPRRQTGVDASCWTPGPEQRIATGRGRGPNPCEMAVRPQAMLGGCRTVAGLSARPFQFIPRTLAPPTSHLGLTNRRARAGRGIHSAASPGIAFPVKRHVGLGITFTGWPPAGKRSRTGVAS